MYRTILLCCFLIATAQLSAQEIEQEIVRPHAFILAFGTASTTEGSVFNVPAADVPASPDLSIYLGYFYSLSEHLALGTHLLGYSQTINNVLIIDASSTSKVVSFDLFPYNVGIQARYLFLTGSVQPFVSAMGNIVLGTLANDQYGTLTLFGFSAGGIAGARVFLFDSVSLSIQGYATFGTSSFKQKPFQNSVDDDFDPSMAGVIFGVAYHWGD